VRAIDLPMFSCHQGARFVLRPEPDSCPSGPVLTPADEVGNGVGV
jgi:hypothetical protein